ncbi:MAG: polysaccharide biosynthesis/export family protein [Chitinophagaceae bacterium]|nr:polysaccharide biosynthesis/export family protein [Chitinophagaceae bacterium]
MLSFRTVVVAATMGALLTSCLSNKKLTDRSVYFKNISDSILNKASIEYEPVFQKGDILSISVITPNEKSARLFNQPNSIAGSSSGGDASVGTSSPVQGGYLINESGEIIFPYLGLIKAAGLSRMALTDTIVSRLRQYIDSAIVSIRLMNYRITVLGEVIRPGTFSIPSERVTVLDAIGLAGDLTIYGKRNNIRIIRNVNGARQTATLNLNSGDIFDSPFFYLRQNDIVYVELNERKIPNTDQATLRNVSLGLGIISAISVIVSTINVLR